MALVAGDTVLAERSTSGARGSAERLASMAAEVLAEAGQARLAAIAVTTGPGSFTGLRAAIALATGFARAAGLPLLGVPVASALAKAVGPLGRRALWVVVASRGERVFLVRDEVAALVDLTALPLPAAPIALAGDAAPAAHAALLARGADALLTSARVPSPRDVARVAVDTLRTGTGDHAASLLPLYAEPAEARLARAAVRDAPLIRAGLPHAAVLAALHADSFSPAERWDAAAFATLLGQPGVFALLDPGGGFLLARVAADEAEILALAVSPAVRRQGRARALVDAARAEAAKLGASAVFLEVAVRNEAARLLYAACGFAPVGQRPAYYPDGGDAVLLRAILPGQRVQPG